MSTMTYTLKYMARGIAFCLTSITIFFVMLIVIYAFAGDTPRDSGTEQSDCVDYLLQRSP